MMTLWIILGIVVIPAIFNVICAYVIVKFNLWNGVSELFLCDGKTNHRVDKTTVLFLIVPFLSLMNFIVIFGTYFAIGMYKIFKVILYPFIWLYGFIANSLSVYFSKIEDKREFYDKLNNH